MSFPQELQKTTGVLFQSHWKLLAPIAFPPSRPNQPNSHYFASKVSFVQELFTAALRGAYTLP